MREKLGSVIQSSKVTIVNDKPPTVVARVFPKSASNEGELGHAIFDVASQNNSIQTNQAADTSSKYRGSQGLDPEFIAELEKYYGFDKPAHERFYIMLKNYLKFDFGESYFKGKRVIDLIIEKMPVSISLGLWTTLIVYLISIPLGIRKAVSDGSQFDVWTSTVIIIGYAIPSFLFAIALVVFFIFFHYAV